MCEKWNLIVIICTVTYFIFSKVLKHSKFISQSFLHRPSRPELFKFNKQLSISFLNTLFINYKTTPPNIHHTWCGICCIFSNYWYSIHNTWEKSYVIQNSIRYFTFMKMTMHWFVLNKRSSHHQSELFSRTKTWIDHEPSTLLRIHHLSYLCNSFLIPKFHFSPHVPIDPDSHSSLFIETKWINTELKWGHYTYESRIKSSYRGFFKRTMDLFQCIQLLFIAKFPFVLMQTYHTYNIRMSFYRFFRIAMKRIIFSMLSIVLFGCVSKLFKK